MASTVQQQMPQPHEAPAAAAVPAAAMEDVEGGASGAMAEVNLDDTIDDIKQTIVGGGPYEFPAAATSAFVKPAPFRHSHPPAPAAAIPRAGGDVEMGAVVVAAAAAGGQSELDRRSEGEGDVVEEELKEDPAAAAAAVETDDPEEQQRRWQRWQEQHAAGVGFRGDVREALRAALAIDRFTAVVEWVAVLSGVNFFLSTACIAAESTGFFLGYNKVQITGGDAAALNLLDVNVGWDRYSIDVNGAQAVTTRFLDDVSPWGYALGCLTFLGHLLSALAATATLSYLYHVMVYGRVAKLAGRHAHARWLSLALLGLGVHLLAFAVLGFPIAVTRDFRRVFGAQLQGFQVRASWAYGLSLIVSMSSLLTGAAIGRRAGAIDRLVATASASTRDGSTV